MYFVYRVEWKSIDAHINKQCFSLKGLRPICWSQNIFHQFGQYLTNECWHCHLGQMKALPGVWVFGLWCLLDISTGGVIRSWAPAAYTSTCCWSASCFQSYSNLLFCGTSFSVTKRFLWPSVKSHKHYDIIVLLRCTSCWRRYSFIISIFPF